MSELRGLPPSSPPRLMPRPSFPAKRRLTAEERRARDWLIESGWQAKIHAAMQDQQRIETQEPRGIDAQSEIAADALLGIARDHGFGVGVAPIAFHAGDYTGDRAQR